MRIARLLSRPSFLPFTTALLVFLIGCIYISFTTVGHIPDVWEHVYRISAITNGDIAPVHVDSISNFHNSAENVGGFVDWDWIELSNELDDGYDVGVVIPESITESNSYGAYVPFNNTAMNTPVAYLPQLGAFILGRALQLSALTKYYLAEFLMLILYAVACGAAVHLTPRNKSVMMIICLLPPLAFRYSFAISADSMTQAVCLVFVSCCYRAFCARKPSDGLLVSIGLLSLVIAFLKLTYMPLVIMSLFILVHHWHTLARTRKVAVLAVTLTAIGCTLAVMQANGWYVTTPSVMSWQDVQLKKHSLLSNPIWALSDIVYSILHFQAYNLVNRLLIFIVWLTALVALALVIIALAKKKNKANTEEAFVSYGTLVTKPGSKTPLFASSSLLIFWLSSVLLSFVILLLIYLALWLQYTPPSVTGVDGIQFRYANTLVPIFIMAICDSWKSLRNVN